MQTNQDHIRVHSGGGMTFVGGDAVELYRLAAMRSAINLHKVSGMIPTRGMTITKMLANVTALTGKAYKGKAKHDLALADLDARIAAAKASMPVVHD
jgi:hypothetical protein